MASSVHLFLFSIAFALMLGSNALSKFKPRAYILPIKKDNVTLQYYTSIQIGEDLPYMDLVIDLGAPFLWLNCDNGYKSSTYRPVRCGSSKCKVAKGFGCVGCNGALRPGCTNNTCGLYPYNPFNQSLAVGGLGEDTLVIYWTDGLLYVTTEDVPGFPFACGHADQLFGLANGVQGMIGLGRTQISLPAKLSSAKKIQQKFALCITSSTESEYGAIFIGGGPYYMPPLDASKFLTKTPLIINPVSTAVIYSEGDPSYEYFIDVKSIRIDGKVVSFNTTLLSFDKQGMGGTKLSTIIPYTVLHSAIYKALIRDFVKKAAAKKIRRVAAVAPFGACFSSKNIASTKTGPAVPTINLEVKGNNTYWRIYGANSMVRVNKHVLCLGFVDGGSEPRTSIVLGGHQLENNLLEFDLASSKLGFTSSLLLHNVTCSASRIF
ncbi:basic 7S globulin-like [Melia azedarach]|uniref:Basic 7S globulin-like n=1 Tax=Melia azedarach TaxID=155640 RepID=A0ACC1YGV7_MELAZ|nr:basic 7S globulin-like [Melia azedarach]